jgi:hypothetical protein
MMWGDNIKLLPIRVNSIRRILLVFLLFALFFHYNLLRIFFCSIQKDNVKNKATSRIDFLAPHHRRHLNLQSPQSSSLRRTNISNDAKNTTNIHHHNNVVISTLTSNITTDIIDINIHATIDHHTPIRSQRKKWAYAFLVSGCSEEKPGYKGFLYNTVVSAKRLKEFGSVADIVIMIQMSESTDARTLPIEEENMLIDNGIKIRYLPKMRSSYHECFYALVQEKFRILQMIEYSRVLFIDADVMPLCNLDYMFELSDPTDTNNVPLLKENAIIAWRGEAANAGFFMMKPNDDDWKQIQREIRRKEEMALTLPWPHWDKVEVRKKRQGKFVCLYEFYLVVNFNF